MTLSTQAIIIAPAVRDIPYSVGTSHESTFSVIGSERIRVVLSGQLAGSATLLTPETMTGCDKTSCAIVVRLVVPDLRDTPGTQDLRVSAVEDPLNQEEGQISAIAKITALVRIHTPPTGQYLSAGLKTNREGYLAGEEVTFITHVTSVGTENVKDISGTLKVYAVGPTDTLNLIFSLPTIESLPVGQSTDLKVAWKPETGTIGSYAAQATLTYADRTTKAKIFGVEIGDRAVKIRGAESLQLETGKINKIPFQLQSYWNEDLSAFVRTRILDSVSSALSESDSKTVTVPSGGSATVDSFIDTTALNEGNYSVEASAIVTNGKNTTKLLNLTITRPAVKEEPALIVASPPRRSNRALIAGIILLAVVVLLLGIITYFRQMKE